MELTKFHLDKIASSSLQTHIDRFTSPNILPVDCDRLCNLMQSIVESVGFCLENSVGLSYSDINTLYAIQRQVREIKELSAMFRPIVFKHKDSKRREVSKSLYDLEDTINRFKKSFLKQNLVSLN